MENLDRQNHIIAILEEQRNSLLNQIVLLNVRIKELEEENKKLREEVELLNVPPEEIAGPTIA